jgi:hypothetical protein
MLDAGGGWAFVCPAGACTCTARCAVHGSHWDRGLVSSGVCDFQCAAVQYCCAGQSKAGDWVRLQPHSQCAGVQHCQVQQSKVYDWASLLVARPDHVLLCGIRLCSSKRDMTGLV